MRILHICSSSSFNGETAHVYSLVRSLQERGHAVTLAYRMRKKGQPVEVHPRLIREYNIQSVFPLPMDKGLSPLENWRGLKELARFIRRENVEIVHCHRAVDHSLAGLLSAFQPAWREKDVPLVRTRHVTTPVKGGQANRWLYERADLLLATASCIQSELLERFPALRPPVKVFHGGVDTQRFSPATPPAGLRKELGLSDNSLLVGSIGHLDPVKGYKNAIDVLAELPDSLPEVHLVICGKEGTQSFQELKQYAQNRSVAAKVHLLGFRRDIDRVITGLDVGLITSTGSEGNSRTALELMASGRPVVSTTAGCLPDLIEPGVQGCLAKPNQVKELADFLSRLLADENLRRRMGESARRRAVEHYDERSVAVELESLYEDLLSRK